MICRYFLLLYSFIYSEVAFKRVEPAKFEALLTFFNNNFWHIKGKTSCFLWYNHIIIAFDLPTLIEMIFTNFYHSVIVNGSYRELTEDKNNQNSSSGIDVTFFLKICLRIKTNSYVINLLNLLLSWQKTEKSWTSLPLSPPANSYYKKKNLLVPPFNHYEFFSLKPLMVLLVWEI